MKMEFMPFHMCLEPRLIKSVKTASRWQRKETESTLQKQLPIPTTPMTSRFWQIHPTKPKHYCIVWNEPPEALASMSMHKNWIYVLYSNRRNLHTRRNLSETSRQIHLPRKQCLINRKGHRHADYEGRDSYRQTIDRMEIRPDR